MSLNDVVNESIAQVSKKHGLSHNYIVVISPKEYLATFDGKLVDIRLEAGNPPKMIIPYLFVFRCFMMEKQIPHVFKDRIQRALEKYKKMCWTLSNQIENDKAMILFSTEKSWMRIRGKTNTNDPIFHDNEFEIDFIAVVRDKVTGKSFSITNKDPLKAKDIAKARLTNIFMNDERLMDFRDQVLGMQDLTPASVPLVEPKPRVVLIQTQIVNGEYEDEEELTITERQIEERIIY
jgi:hypothetical protein